MTASSPFDPASELLDLTRVPLIELGALRTPALVTAIERMLADVIRWEPSDVIQVQGQAVHHSQDG